MTESVMASRVDLAGPLVGTRVLDLADETGSFCGRVLADLGADVIKVEEPGGDRCRGTGPFLDDRPHPDGSLTFWHRNANKRGITLDLGKTAARRLLVALLDVSDVVVETPRQRCLGTAGLDYDAVSSRNRGLIVASITPYGPSGPFVNHLGCDIVVAAMGGWTTVSGEPGLEPLQPFGDQSYYVGSLFATFGILLALRERRTSGRGQQVAVSLQEAVASTTGDLLVRAMHREGDLRRTGAVHWSQTGAVVPCRDGHVWITFGSREWDTLVELLAVDGMAGDLSEAEWVDETFRRRNAAHVVSVLTTWTIRRSADEIVALGQSMRFPWAPVCSPHDVVRSPQAMARDYFVPVEHEDIGREFMYPGGGFKLSPAGCHKWRRPPHVGEHNVQVYQQLLGLSECELKELAAAGVI